MSYYGNFGENWGGAAHHAHYNPNIFAGLPATQHAHHHGAQTIGGFSATDPWLNSSGGMPMNIHHANYGRQGPYYY